MNRRNILMDIRTSGNLKGVKPAVIYMRINSGKMYNDGYADFVMSYRNEILYFQKLSYWLKRLKPAEDFEYPITRFKEYTQLEHMASNTLYLYDDDKNYLEIHYNKGTIDTAPGEDNIKRIIAILEEHGCKKIELLAGADEDEGTNTGTEKSN